MKFDIIYNAIKEYLRDKIKVKEMFFFFFSPKLKVKTREKIKMINTDKN